MDADWISVKTDAVTEDTWRIINRPDEKLQFRKYQEGIQHFTGNYAGKLVTETMLVDGMNDTIEHLKELASFIAKLQPSVAYISVPIRPPAVKSIKMPSAEKLNRAYQVYAEHDLKVEILMGFEGTDTGFTGNAREDILNIAAVHPLREDSINQLLSKNKADFTVVESLIEQGLIEAVSYNSKKYFIRKYHI